MLAMAVLLIVGMLSIVDDAMSLWNFSYVNDLTVSM